MRTIRFLHVAILGWLLALSPAISATAQKFPAVGHTYLVDFKAFKVQLYFESETSLTYTGVKKDGSLGASETVAITVTPIRSGVFMVTWQENDKTTVVHIEDYARSVFYTNITDGASHQFDRFVGTVRQIK